MKKRNIFSVLVSLLALGFIFIGCLPPNTLGASGGSGFKIIETEDKENFVKQTTKPKVGGKSASFTYDREAGTITVTESTFDSGRGIDKGTYTLQK